MVDWLKKAPTAVVITLIIVLGMLVFGVLAAFVILQLRGVDTAPLRQWISAVGIPLISLLMGVNTVASVQSARSASNAEDQTNGQLTSRDARIAQLEGVVRAAGLVVPASTVVERKAGN
jgi:hypothetical protein